MTRDWLSPDRKTACCCTLLVLLLPLFCSFGCRRNTYRKWADRDAYRLIKSRENDPRWNIPTRVVEPDPRSRLADIQDPDAGPPTLDDPAAECYMRHPYNSKKRVTYWDKRGNPVAIDSEQWLEYLPYDEEGNVVLDKQLTVDMALLNSREFQTRVERLYITALALSANRFEYALNWFGGSDTDFFATDDGVEAVRDLSVNNNLGFTRNLATGGQFAVTMLNSFAWNFGGSGNSNFAGGNVVFNLTQPLLRGAFRHVRTEALTQAERNLLYEIRDFAHFRREFYQDIVTQYLSLVNQAQEVRNDEENLENLRRNLDEFQAAFELGTVSTIEVDQVFQQFQSGRIDLINRQLRLQNSLDAFKFQMGLPARTPIKFDEGILQPFQLNDPELEKLQSDAQILEQSMMKYLPMDGPAPPEFLDEIERQLIKYSNNLAEMAPGVKADLERWTDKLKSSPPSEDASKQDVDEYELQTKLAEEIALDLDELQQLIESAAKANSGEPTRINPPLRPDQDQNDRNAQPDNGDNAAQDENRIPDGIPNDPAPANNNQDDDPLIVRWKNLQGRIADRGGLTDRISKLFVAQTQVRLFLIEIRRIEIEEQVAVDLALENRFELMNSRALVVDAYRAVEIAADQLQSDLDVRASADLRTDPTKNNAFRIDGDENIYQVGIEFDGPLNRFNERNAYRVAQIAYQQERRNYMAVEDSIVNSVRVNIRDLRTNLLNFQITRQQLLTAARQVEEAQLNLRESATGTSSQTRDLLLAIERLRDSKNSLIRSWSDYETSRIALYVDLELLLLDSNGVWINDRGNFDEYISSGRTEPNDIEPLGESETAPDLPTIGSGASLDQRSLDQSDSPSGSATKGLDDSDSPGDRDARRSIWSVLGFK